MLPPSSFPFFPLICLILSFIFCLYRLQTPILTYYRRRRHHQRQHNLTQDHYLPLAIDDSHRDSLTSSQSHNTQITAHHPEELRALPDSVPPATPLSRYFDPQTALLYGHVFERRTVPPSPRWEREMEFRGRGGEQGMGSWFERGVECVVRYYEELAWGR
ncbi:uncharacterized protein BO97DRAFT_414095 [Aspergillus homomorphus CBS 101889]|uniref:Uncharacterized protein n=1 Tax=Aspergillus homomorphus (strain CBS 101889) TaxID=1450537 RepID=A0A395HZ48_ASPHC|nr:hypothetical protein BO97DRAFT_414095 [Aspergillus homomorphus CBS 101889]RAL12745.1 hypothetical protein BO97DRAFT_414095 [Aspergillus homomorphus CBS 101889]